MNRFFLTIHLSWNFDRRDLSTDTGSHWADDSLGRRAYFHVAARPAALTIKNTTAEDNGVYRCRVDFQKSPTRNSKVELRVISLWFIVSNI
uniref:Ig-like domain-containing protein n=1 Tax=Megaselia scalaris TaxID=36166 RepID=T1GRC7_MEGSC